MSDRSLVNAYDELRSTWSPRTRARKALRDAAVMLFSLRKSIGSTSGWIRFPYYHHVFRDERRGFSRQLDYLNNFGDFLSLDQAVDLLASGSPVDGRYFCVTFDDGIRSCYEHAFPILAEKEISAGFFVVTQYTADTGAGETRVCRPLHPGAAHSNQYLTWQECREILQAGMVLGSHTCSHLSLIDSDADEIRRQLSRSKQTIEAKLAVACNHFACPWGIPRKNFLVDRDPQIARDLGYRSFLTTERGPMMRAGDPYRIRRDHILAVWGNYQLRYFLSL